MEQLSRECTCWLNYWNMHCWMAFLLHEAYIADLTNRPTPQKNLIPRLISYENLWFTSILPISKKHCDCPGELLWFTPMLLNVSRRSSNANTTALLQTVSSNKPKNSGCLPVLLDILNKDGMTETVTQTFKPKTQYILSIYGVLILLSYSCTSSTWYFQNKYCYYCTNAVWYQYNASIPGIFNDSMYCQLECYLLPTHLLHPVVRSIDLQ